MQTEKKVKKNSKSPLIIGRAEHNVSRKDFSPNAIKVLYRLKDGGYDAYLVGGCIRDVLLGVTPKDFDVVTNATPEQVKRLFRNCRIIGRRFRLAHIVFGREIIEVATMRGHHEGSEDKNPISQSSTEGQLLRDNVFGSIDEDAERRDFSINALYYSINDYSIHDYANGMDAIKHRRIELIGNPETRYREDPVRMLRAIRFATKLDMTIAPDTEKPIYELADLLSNIPAARLFEEVLKLFLNGKAEQNFVALRQYGLFKQLFPALDLIIEQSKTGEELKLITQMFINTDTRINADKKVTPAFVFAALLWYPMVQRAEQLIKETKLDEYEAYTQAGNEVVAQNAQHIAVPKHFTQGSREIWQIQLRLPKRGGQRAYRLAQQPRFRAAYDFLLLRTQITPGPLQELANWWTEYQKRENIVPAPLHKPDLAEKPSHSGDKPAARRRPRRRFPSKKPNSSEQ
ncbi:polynucleotide adenylyltransferase PcnB [Pseudoalteromonas tunicata]|uniref:polynucleotide adenylyltransferase PcnB n=1 Tax=Pseudoalteromonas tunicata TaxID=314281 RepID=UPI00273ECFBA|nr:polynucleotide adenylyltransferase PcnB [Pseudoalteromonas tunicata]MDP5214035.1 polynucleotide adenylyltransferase PcnB [Pseudoalteromonas tunicata]